MQQPIFKYPENGRSFVVTQEEYARLNSGQELNDVNIDFSLRWTFDKMTTQMMQRQTHLFTTAFIQSWRRGGDDETECYQRVRNWTRRVNIFAKRWLLLPIIERKHWYLVIVQNPGQTPYGWNRNILVFDSYSNQCRDQTVADIRSYIRQEHKTKFPTEHHDASFSEQELPAIHVKTPQQQNNVDCGVFTLLYAEKFLVQPLEDVKADHRNWFTSIDADTYRCWMKKVMRSLEYDQRTINDEVQNIVFSWIHQATNPGEHPSTKRARTLPEKTKLRQITMDPQVDEQSNPCPSSVQETSPQNEEGEVADMISRVTQRHAHLRRWRVQRQLNGRRYIIRGTLGGNVFVKEVEGECDD